ncbi:MAG: hypothetical protein PHF70_10370, partial [Opitutales bacterium]|nr:hypothetical protein [Opitutales bacterium]
MTKGGRLGWWIVLALMLMGGGLFGLKPAYRGLKAWRANQIAKDVVATYLSAPKDQEAVTDAALRARSALVLNPDGFAPNRALGILLTGVRPSEALGVWDRALAASPDVSRDGAL